MHFEYETQGKYYESKERGDVLCNNKQLNTASIVQLLKIGSEIPMTLISKEMNTQELRGLKYYQVSKIVLGNHKTSDTQKYGSMFF